MKKRSLFKKIITCLVAGLVLSGLLLLVGNSGTLWWFPPAAVFSLVAISLLLALGFPYIWQYKERRSSFNTLNVDQWLFAFIRYCIAFDIASFGWKKLFGLQFVVPVQIAEKPMNQQNGEWLTWYYFGHSFIFGAIVAAIQIVGSLMLLFRKTTLLGAITLFSLMVNITLINIFYKMNMGALLQSVIMTTGILFLILLDYSRLVEFFLRADVNSSSLNSLTKNMLRLSAIILSLLFTIYLKWFSS